jgi:hypothetical protein
MWGGCGSIGILFSPKCSLTIKAECSRDFDIVAFVGRSPPSNHFFRIICLFIFNSYDNAQSVRRRFDRTISRRRSTFSSVRCEWGLALPTADRHPTTHDHFWTVLPTRTRVIVTNTHLHTPAVIFVGLLQDFLQLWQEIKSQHAA